LGRGGRNRFADLSCEEELAEYSISKIRKKDRKME
jgi:hypothetical protein